VTHGRETVIRWFC